jgi:hypothetical protein
MEDLWQFAVVKMLLILNDSCSASLMVLITCWPLMMMLELEN